MVIGSLWFSVPPSCQLDTPSYLILSVHTVHVCCTGIHTCPVSLVHFGSLSLLRVSWTHPLILSYLYTLYTYAVQVYTPVLCHWFTFVLCPSFVSVGHTLLSYLICTHCTRMLYRYTHLSCVIGSLLFSVPPSCQLDTPSYLILSVHTVHVCCTGIHTCPVSLVHFCSLSLLCVSWTHPPDCQRSACHQPQAARRAKCSGLFVKVGELPCLTDVCPPEGSCERETDASVNVPLVSAVWVGGEEEGL